MKKSAGKIILRPMGEYDPSVTYSCLDLVTLNNNLYIVKAALVTGVSPESGDTSKWDLLINGWDNTRSLGTVISPNADYAEVGEWVDGNPSDEDRIGYFVAIDDTTAGTTMIKAKSTSDVRGVTVSAPAFSGNCSPDKFDSEGNLLKQYDYVAVMGLVPIIDNGTCTINGRCMPADDGTAIPSTNNMGYQVIDRLDDTHVLIGVEPSADMLNRIKTQMVKMQEQANETEAKAEALQTQADSTDESLNRLWELNRGIVDSDTAYTKDVPTDAKMCNIKQLGGKTIVWNQILKEISGNDFWNINQIDAVTTSYGDGVLSGSLKSASSSDAVGLITKVGRFVSVIGHKYYMSCKYKVPRTTKCRIGFYSTYNTAQETKVISETDGFVKFDAIVTGIADDGRAMAWFMQYDSGWEIGDAFKQKEFMCIDLTKMFGAGNEPSTVEEFESMFPDEYYEYNEGTLLSAPVNEVVSVGKNLCKPTIDNLMCRLGYKLVANDGKAMVGSNGDIEVINSTSSKVYGYIIPIEALKTYTVSATCKYATYNVTVQCCYYQNDNLIGNSNFTLGKGEKGVKTVTIPEGATHLLVGGISTTSSGTGEGSGVNFTIGNIQIEKGSEATDFVPYNSDTLAIPQAILDLDGYGDSVGSVYNYVDFENKKYHKRVGKVDLGTLNYTYINENINNPVFRSFVDRKYAYGNYNIMCAPYATYTNSHSTGANIDSLSDDKTLFVNSGSETFFIRDSSCGGSESFLKAVSGVMLYYELATEEVIDISDLFDSTTIPVETGGTLTFKNTNGDGFRIPVPNTVEYKREINPFLLEERITAIEEELRNIRASMASLQEAIGS